MAIGSGTLSLSTIAGEYGGSVPHNISEYYRGGGNVPVSSNTSTIPSSGTIDLQDFQNTSNTAPTDSVFSGTVGSFYYSAGKSTYGGAGINSYGLGSFSDNSITTKDGSSTVTVNRMTWNPESVLNTQLFARIVTSGGSNNALGYSTWVVSNSASQFGQSSSGTVFADGNSSFGLASFPPAGHVPATQFEVGAGSGNYAVLTSTHNTPAQRLDNGFTLTITLS